MATVSKWNPFGVTLTLTATAGTVTRKSATQFTVPISVTWKTYWNGAQTNYGMTASSGGGSATINTFGKIASSGSGSFTGTFSISGNAAATTTITVTFRNFNNDNGKSATKTIDLSVSVPAWTSYTVKYNANGGSGAPSSQTKYKDQALTLSSTKPTRTGYSFQGWATSASGGVAYASGAKYTANADATLYAVWRANTYTVSYNANGGSGAPGSQTKTYGVTLTLSSTKPTKTNYTFKGWGTSASATTVSYAAGASYTTNAAITLYAIWELAYTKPRINNLSVTRCNSEGAPQTDGTYALVEFSWICDKTISSIKIDWKLSTAGSYASSATVSATGASGFVSQVVGSGALAAESSYDIRATVTDSMGHSELSATLSSMLFTIHAKPGGTGIAFGKMQEKDNCIDVGWDIEMNGHHIMNNGDPYFPELLLGVEYRTAQRYNGKPVYAKAVNVEALPSTNYKEVHFAYNIDAIVRLDGYAYWNTTLYTDKIPISNLTYFNVKIELYGHSAIRFTTYSDMSNYSAYAVLYYTKTTD